MTQKGRVSAAYNELKKVLLDTKGDQRLEALKNEFRNAAVKERRVYKRALLKLAQEGDSEPFHNIMFETLASLDTIWTEHIPRRGLAHKFNQAFEAGNDEDAAQICSELIRQGLDYHGTIDIGPGILLPLHLDEPKLLQFTQNEIKILDLDLNLLHRVKDIPTGHKIIDVLPPFPYREPEEGTEGLDVDARTWILLENTTTGQRTIIPLTLDIQKFDLPFQIDIKTANDPQKADPTKANHISRFKNHLLLVGEKVIFYYRPEKGWDKWISTGAPITCFEQTSNYYWVGLDDGHVRIIKSIEKSGLRKPFSQFSGSIKSLSSTDRFVAVGGKNFFCIANIESTIIMEPMKTKCPIIQTEIPDSQTINILLANGMFENRDIRHGNILWQINLEDQYERFFKIEEKIYIHKANKSLKIFTIPDTQSYVKHLEKKNVAVTDRKMERDPRAPIGDIGEFTGRKGIFDEIKNQYTCHFLITGVPKSGKTSLLKVLGDVLIGNSRCCYIDIKEIIEKFQSFKSFEFDFISKCLIQHTIPLNDLKNIEGYQIFKETVTKIRKKKDFCVFCLDNFFILQKDTSDWNEKFKLFIKEMFVNQYTRMIMTCSPKDKKKIEEYFKEIQREIPVEKELRSKSISIFSEIEAKDAIRKLGFFSRNQVEHIFKYTGCFPHLIRLYEKLHPKEENLEDYSRSVAEDYSKYIFAFFRELSADAKLFLATLLYKKLMQKKISFDLLYQDFPLLSQIIPETHLKGILEEISNHLEGFIAEFNDENFVINIQNPALLFHEASKSILWIKVLFTLYKFTTNPNWQNADKLASQYTEMVGIKSFFDKTLGDFDVQYKADFYIRKLTVEARKAVGMPLDTFIVIPLDPWVRDKTIQRFNNLYTSIMNYVQKESMANGEESPQAKFYILIFTFLGMTYQEIDEEMMDLERVSIIDSKKMKQLILSDSPLDTSSEIIFQQLRISERSPYTVSGAVRELFYGRRLEIALIRGLPENIGIFGTRTIGKTSLMLKLYHSINKKKWRVYAVDCSKIESEKALLMNLAEKMDIKSRLISNIEKFRKYISKRAESDKVRYLFLLDEVDGLIVYDTKHKEKIFRTFNRLCTESLRKGGFTAARFILFGFAHMFEQMKNPSSRLYNFMVFLPLQSLDYRSGLSLVTTPMKSIRIKWENEKDAQYLVHECSRHPLLLQAACQSLLEIIDKKNDSNRDLIKKSDVEKALISEQFQLICMRYYLSTIRPSKFSTHLFEKIGISKSPEEDPFLHDIHKIAILVRIVFHTEKKKSTFTLTQLQSELNEYGLKISPDMMRKIIHRLCLFGTIRLIEEPTLITFKENEIKEEIKQLDIKLENRQIDSEEVKIIKPDILKETKETFFKFRYEFAVKIFPKLVVANFDGTDNIKKEIQQLVEQREWEKWLRRH